MGSRSFENTENKIYGTACVMMKRNITVFLPLSLLILTGLTNRSPVFDKSRPFEITAAKRSIATQSSEKDTTMCNGWSVSAKNIQKIIKDSKPLSGEDWHHLFGVLPCTITGTLKQGTDIFTYEINAGSWMFIHCPDTTLLLGSYRKQYERYFLSSAWNE